MNKTKKPKKVRLDDNEENVSPPWEAWWHTEKLRKFYVNPETKQSIWEHPNGLKKEESTSKKSKGSRKRRDVDVINQNTVDDYSMEVDLPPPPKRKTTQLETDEQTPKRARRSTSQEKYESAHYPPNSSEPIKILPSVPWNSEIRPLNRLQYRGCAIFDTCALLENPCSLNASIDKKLLTVIPYAVHSELDGLKNNLKTANLAREVNMRLKELLAEKNCYLWVETSKEQTINIEDFRPDKKVNDDAILKCALRIKEEVLSIAPKLNLNDRAVLLVTNDLVLSNKAMIHGLTVESLAKFMEIINGNVAPQSISKIQKTPSTSTAKQADKSSEIRRKQPPIPSEPSKTKVIAVESIRGKREVTAWISEMAKKAVESDVTALAEISKSCERTPRTRIAIPLEDEVLPSIAKSVGKKTSYTPQLAYKPKNTKKPIQLSENCPKMPCSVSDDEVDEMDCT